MKIFKGISAKRIIIQGLMAFLIYYAYIVLNIQIRYIIIAALVAGIIFGKIFCRWMCPIGFIMELMLLGRKREDTMQHQFMYHKIGCPIAWVTGFLNKYSIFKIKHDASKCTSCGVCDKTCYITAIDQKHSLYDESKEDAGKSFRCSKCLECVDKCPTDALTYKPGK